MTDRDDGWVESTEGDLDPDLAEEAPYSAWEAPPHRAWWPIAYRIIAVIAIAALVIPVILSIVR